MPTETRRRPFDSAVAVWFVLRLLSLGVAAGALITMSATHSITAAVVVAAMTLACSLLDGWILRIRHVYEPVDGGVRVAGVLDTWQPVAAFAGLSQIGHFLSGSTGQHVVLASLAVATCLAIFVSRRFFD